MVDNTNDRHYNIYANFFINESPKVICKLLIASNVSQDIVDFELHNAITDWSRYLEFDVETWLTKYLQDIQYHITKNNSGTVLVGFTCERC